MMITFCVFTIAFVLGVFGYAIAAHFEDEE